MERALILAALLAASDEESYRRILAADDVATQSPARGWLQNANSRARLRRVEADYRHFIAAHPEHAPAIAAYGGFLYDQGRQDEAVRLWQRALEVDPKFANAYNDLATHFGHAGRAADALRYLDRAIEMDATNALFHFNWATTCIMFRVDARQVYGWSEDEIFRRSLDAFRKARDLAPQEYEYATSYAESFYLWGKADWTEAYAAWEYCLKAAPTDLQRQQVCSHLARVGIHLHRYEEARGWLAKVEEPQLRSLRNVLERKLARAAAGIQQTEHDQQRDDHSQH